jgi:hypothetical protein
MITKALDAILEFPHALSACVTLAREVRDDLRAQLEAEQRETERLRQAFKVEATECARLRFALNAAAADRDKKIAELEELRDAILSDCAARARERDELARQLDWLLRERRGPCPFPPRTWVFWIDDGAPLGCEAEDVDASDEWRPANLDLYECFKEI